MQARLKAPTGGPGSGGEPGAAPRAVWQIPYVDQPVVFWVELEEQLGAFIREVYFPLPGTDVGSGRPMQPMHHLQAFLRGSPFAANALVNPVVLKRPIEVSGPAIIEQLRQLRDGFGVTSVTVSNVALAALIREQLPDLTITASVLLDIHTPYQVQLLDGLFDVLVPSSRIMRDIEALKRVRHAFRGKLRLIVNEGCLPGCPFRVQHFYEMNAGLAVPKSLCAGLLRDKPWLRLTGAWVLPQHLHYYRQLFDELKIAGRVTLQNERRYRQVLKAYFYERRTLPSQIGGGPASLHRGIPVDDAFYEHTLRCGHDCHECDDCARYYDERAAPEARGTRPQSAASPGPSGRGRATKLPV